MQIAQETSKKRLGCGDENDKTENLSKEDVFRHLKNFFAVNQKLVDKFTPGQNESISEDQEYEFKMEMAIQRAKYFDNLWFEHKIGEESLLMCM